MEHGVAERLARERRQPEAAAVVAARAPVGVVVVLAVRGRDVPAPVERLEVEVPQRPVALELEDGVAVGTVTLGGKLGTDVVVDLGSDLEGFVPKSQLGVHNLKDPADVFKETQPLDLRVLECDAANRRIVLTVTAIPEWTPPEPLRALMEQ